MFGLGHIGLIGFLLIVCVGLVWIAYELVCAWRHRTRDSNIP